VGRGLSLSPLKLTCLDYDELKKLCDLIKKNRNTIATLFEFEFFTRAMQCLFEPSLGGLS
jgi:hypothetical protein